MKQIYNFVKNICLRAKDTTKELGNAFSDVVFLFPELAFYIGLLIQFLPSLIISRVIRNKGQQTVCLIKNVFALITLSTKDLQIDRLGRC